MSSSVWAQDLQRVFELPGRSAASIAQAAQISLGNVERKTVSDSAISFRAQTHCLIGSGFFAVKLPLNSDVIIEAREGRYRFTVQNAYFPETGALGVKLQDHAADSSTRKSCMDSLELFAAGLHSKIQNYKDF